MRRSRLAPFALAGALVAVVVLIGASVADSDRRLHAVFPSAKNMVAGLEVRAAGHPVGTISSVEATGDGRARLELAIADDDVWPLAHGTTARLRWGGNVSFASRYVELEPGPAGAPAIPDGGLISGSSTVAPVEVDRILRTLDERRRAQLTATIDRGGAALGSADDELRAVLRRVPSPLARTRALLADLGADPLALQALVRSTDRVVHAVARSRPGVESLVSGAATTFDAAASQADDIETTLAQTSHTLATARGTLARADHTLIAAKALTERLRPGIREVRQLADPAAGVLGRLVEVGPLARSTLATARRAAPDVDALLERLRPVMPRVASIGRQADRQVHCLRPYGPEIAGFASTWSGFLANGDGADKYARVLVQQTPTPTGTPMIPKEAAATFPGFSYAFPRPPGFNVGKPWFIPECGVGPEAVDPSQDPEAEVAAR